MPLDVLTYVAAKNSAIKEIKNSIKNINKFDVKVVTELPTNLFTTDGYSIPLEENPYGLNLTDIFGGDEGGILKFIPKVPNPTIQENILYLADFTDSGWKFELITDYSKEITFGRSAGWLVTLQDPDGEKWNNIVCSETDGYLSQYNIILGKNDSVISDSTIYFVPSDSEETDNSYDEYIYIPFESKFEKIGSTALDLSDYVKYGNGGNLAKLVRNPDGSTSITLVSDTSSSIDSESFYKASTVSSLLAERIKRVVVTSESELLNIFKKKCDTFENHIVTYYQSSSDVRQCDIYLVSHRATNASSVLNYLPDNTVYHLTKEGIKMTTVNKDITSLSQLVWSSMSIDPLIEYSGSTDLNLEAINLHNHEIRLTVYPTSINFDFSEDEESVVSFPQDYNMQLSFMTGTTAPLVSYTANGHIVQWVGQDCSVEEQDGQRYSIFAPIANKQYDIMFYFNGTYFVGAVNGYVPSVSNEVV